MTNPFKVICEWNLKATLGEGPIWSPKDHAVWFVDIKQSKIHRFDVRIGSKQSWTAPSSCGFIAPRKRGGFVVGCKTGLYLFEPKTGDFTLLTHVEPHLKDNRLNDGYVDAKGRLWFGSMDDDETHPTGAFYRYDARGLKKMDDDYVITNGPAVSPDSKTLYHNDTLKKIIYAFDLDDDGELNNKRVFARLDIEGHIPPHGQGYMDGPVVDSAGNIWNALFFGWGVNGYYPDGRLIHHVKFPVSNVTKIAFGGHDLKTVYATTAAKGLSPDDLKTQPLAGGLFSFETDIAGQPQYELIHV